MIIAKGKFIIVQWHPDELESTIKYYGQWLCALVYKADISEFSRIRRWLLRCKLITKRDVHFVCLNDKQILAFGLLRNIQRCKLRSIA